MKIQKQTLHLKYYIMVTVVVDLLTSIIMIDQCEIFRLHLLIG